jgi:putative restriction endonuclease
MVKNLAYYKDKFETLRVNKNKTRGDAPHKPILLLAIIKLFEKKAIGGNRIYFDEVINDFMTNWQAYVTTDHDPRVALPFSHLPSSGFWKLIPKEGFEFTINLVDLEIIKNIKATVDYAEIDYELSVYFSDPKSRNELKDLLLEKYFPQTKNINPYESGNYDSDLIKEILEESPSEYKNIIFEREKILSPELFQQETVGRNAEFKRVVPRIYGYACCISEMFVTFDGIQMVDACHIVPFSESYNDTISNGIALCPNLHRAFDRGMISIDDNYKVLISNRLKENSSNYSIKEFSNKQILLPENPKYYPSLESLASHRAKFGF